MKIALLGYGRMGHEIETTALARNHTIILKACTHKPFTPQDLLGADAAIEFSAPHAAVENIYKCFEANCPVVVGTTGWYTRLPEVRDQALSRNQSILYSTNFSIGVNILFHINRILAHAMEQLNEYEPAIHEIHHIHKLDQPSGTAITLAEGIIENYSRKKKWINAASVSNDELSITSTRTSEVPGTHTITYTSPADTISLQHEAKNRTGFALGAVKAAEWLHTRTGVFTLNDMLHFS